jgi:hypothetical protein
MSKIKSECTPEEWAVYIAARLAYKKKWVAANRDKVRTQARASRIQDPERHRQYSREYYAKNRERILDRLKAENTPPERQERRRETWRKYNARADREEARRKIDMRPQTVAKRRAYAKSEEARKRARDVMEQRYQKDPYIRKRVANHNRLRRTGFTPEMVAAKLVEQNNACAICRRQFSAAVIMHADHCHATQKPRGLLCLQCNIIDGKLESIGMMPVEFGQLLQEYRKKHE